VTRRPAPPNDLGAAPWARVGDEAPSWHFGGAWGSGLLAATAAATVGVAAFPAVLYLRSGDVRGLVAALVCLALGAVGMALQHAAHRSPVADVPFPVEGYGPVFGAWGHRPMRLPLVAVAVSVEALEHTDPAAWTVALSALVSDGLAHDAQLTEAPERRVRWALDGWCVVGEAEAVFLAQELAAWLRGPAALAHAASPAARVTVSARFTGRDVPFPLEPFHHEAA
jgi:hypothetical protein